MQIVCHAFPAWDGNYLKSTVELMKRMAERGHQVLYVDYAYTWKDFFTQPPAARMRMLGLQARIRCIPVTGTGTLQVLTLPPVFPSNFLKQPSLFDFVNRLNSVFMLRAIKSAMARLKFHQPVVINAFNPSFGVHLAGKLQERLLLYYCYDEISAANWAGKHGPRLEKQFIQVCDVVVCSSEGLQNKLAAQHPNVQVVKNGVDFNQFFHKLPEEMLPPIPGKTPGQKVIGYLGSVDDRLDFALLESQFRRFSDTLFVFVGRVQEVSIQQKLLAFSNVYLAGAFPATDLQGWVQQMDVCLIPFVKNKFTAGIYPLKINEYLAAGKPVVSTRFAPLQEFEEIVFLTETAQFGDAIQQALDSGEKTEYQEFARKNDWMARAEQLEKIIAP
jgi:glycosyltransferase involved in cell wall biosynthesis